MENQQPSPLVRLARNAKLGDGSLWKHPSGINRKVIYTSTTPELLEIKRLSCPEIFKTGVRPVDCTNHKGRFPNAKPLYRLASITDVVFTQYAAMSLMDVFNEIDIVDLGLWYLDDGCCVRRRDSSGYRFYLSIGKLCPTDREEAMVISKFEKLLGAGAGNIYLNGSAATANNKTFVINKQAAFKVLVEADKYGILSHKIPREWFND